MCHLRYDPETPYATSESEHAKTPPHNGFQQTAATLCQPEYTVPQCIPSGADARSRAGAEGYELPTVAPLGVFRVEPVRVEQQRICLVRNVQHDASEQIKQTNGSNGGRRNAYSTTELTDSRRGISLRARNQATRRPARRQHGSGAKPTTARRRRSAPRRAERRAAPLPRRPRRSSAFSSDLTHRCRIVHPQHWPENLDYSGSA